MIVRCQFIGRGLPMNYRFIVIAEAQVHWVIIITESLHMTDLDLVTMVILPLDKMVEQLHMQQ